VIDKNIIKNKMEVSLTNFRCWESKTLMIPSTGICLINGRSGKGKSSILNSILYAVTGKIKNITTINKKNTMVNLKIDNISITRSKGPNRLVVEKEGKIYEDIEAQSIINSVFGDKFCNTSYIDQDNIYSFVYLSPSEKMEFLEKLLLDDFGIEKIKDNIRIEISKTKTEYTSEESKINTMESILSMNPLKDKENVELVMDKVRVNSLNYTKILDKVKSNRDISEKNIKSLKLKIKKLEDEYKLYSKKIEKIDRLNFLLKDIKLDSLYEEFRQIDVERELKELEKNKKYYIQNKEYINHKKKYEELDQKYKIYKEKNDKDIIYLQKEISDIEDQSKGKNFSMKRVAELEKCIELIDKIFVMEEKLKDPIDFDSEIKKETDENEKMKELLLKKQKIYEELSTSYDCPSCHSVLRIDSNKLVLYNKETSSNVSIDEIEKLKSEIKKSEKKISYLKKDQDLFKHTENQYNDLFDQLDTIRGEIECDKEEIEKEICIINKYIEVDKKNQSLKDDKYVLYLKKEITETEKKLELYNKDINNINNINNTDDKIKGEDEYVECLNKISRMNQYKELLIKIKSIENELLSYEDKDNGKDEHYFKNMIDIMKSENESLETYIMKNENYKTYIEKLSEWDRENKEIERCNVMKKTIESSIEKKNKLSDRIRCLVKLRDHVKNAEQKCISDFIDSLNEHASIYIEQFFPDEDIKVELKTIQEAKSTGKEKVCLNFEISYRQIIGDLSYLSGGERDRINLAFTLAFSEMINNRVLLLDECISSLDAETTNIVLENLKEKYKGKLVILVSHQANLGFFDKVIDL